MSFIRQNDASYTTQTAGYDAGLRSYMLKVYNYMAAALGLTGLVAYIVAATPALYEPILFSPLKWVVIFAPLIMVFYLGAKVMQMSPEKAKMLFWVYAGLMGLSLSSIMLAYSPVSVVRVFFITAGTFGGLSLYGYTTKRDLSGMGSFLMMGLIGLIIASVVNIFLASSALHFAVSMIGVLIFAGLTAYDTQNLKRIYYSMGASDNLAVMGALKLYLDFINMFVFLMQFFGDRR